VQGGRVRLIYEFDDPAQLADFPVDTQAPAWVTHVDLDADPLCSVEGGAMQLRGSVTRRFRLPLEWGKITYTVKFTDVDTEFLGQAFYILMCLDAQEPTYVRTLNAHDLHVVSSQEMVEDLAKNRHTTVHRPIIMTAQRHQSGDVTFEGEGRSARLDGRQLTGADVAIQAFSNHIIRVERIELEGQVSEAGRAKMKATWISEELERLGLR
jgi:hypothetical protein